MTGLEPDVQVGRVGIGAWYGWGGARGVGGRGGWVAGWLVGWWLAGWWLAGWFLWLAPHVQGVPALQ